MKNEKEKRKKNKREKKHKKIARKRSFFDEELTQLREKL